MVNPNIPVIDLHSWTTGSHNAKSAVASQVRQACESIGFFTIVGHGLSPDIIEKTDADAAAFFDLPFSEKSRVRGASPGLGYLALDIESLAATSGTIAPGDIKETLNVGRDPVQINWQENLASLRQSLTTYFGVMDTLAATLMHVFAVALDLPEQYFDSLIDRANAILRVVNYPAHTAEPKAGQMRAGPHTDYGTLTILTSWNDPGGLQVCTRDGDWIDVVIAPGSFVVNIGDLMMYWTNDLWKSTLHRVTNPLGRQRPELRRQSLVFFHNPNFDAKISCLETCCDPDRPAKYPQVTAGSYLLMKSAASRGQV